MPWFKRADGILFNILEMYPDTIARLRSEGWAEVADPNAPANNEPTVAAQAEVVTPASSPERAAPSQQPQADTSDTKKPAPVAKRAPVKPKTVKRRTPVRRPTARKAAS